MSPYLNKSQREIACLASGAHAPRLQRGGAYRPGPCAIRSARPRRLGRRRPSSARTGQSICAEGPVTWAEEGEAGLID